MNNDPFTKAARAEAGRRWRDPALDHDPIGMAVDLALWARTYLTEQGPTDGEVEAAARALADWDGADGWGTPGWTGHVPEPSYVHGARAALSAARAARRGGKGAP